MAVRAVVDGMYESVKSLRYTEMVCCAIRRN